MKTWFAKYNKLWVAASGFALLFFLKRADIELPGVTEAVTELMVSLLASWGVYEAANAKPAPETDDTDDFRGV